MINNVNENEPFELALFISTTINFLLSCEMHTELINWYPLQNKQFNKSISNYD